MYVSPCLSFLSLFLLGKENIKLKSVNKFVNNPYANCMWYSGSDKSWMKDFQLSYFMDVKISDYSRQKNRKRNYLLFIMYIYLKNLEIQNLFFFSFVTFYYKSNIIYKHTAVENFLSQVTCISHTHCQIKYTWHVASPLPLTYEVWT